MPFTPLRPTAQPVNLLARFTEILATTVRHWWPAAAARPAATPAPAAARRRLVGRRFMLTRKEPVLELFRALASVEYRPLAT